MSEYKKNGKGKYLNKKRFTVYEPNYKPGGFYIKLFSKFKAFKLCKKLGVGSLVVVSRLQGNSKSFISFWNYDSEYEWR